jgi:hypothetical protein
MLRICPTRSLPTLAWIAIALVVSVARAQSPPQAGDDRDWAFRPPQRPEIPQVADRQWIRTPADAFVLARLERAGLQPSPQADRRTLTRRIYFDLTGLPPTPEQLDSYLADRSVDAYQRLVDRLLGSPEYGERWAQHWLDVVRYADSDGFEYDDPRPHAWRYRDWVIEALNSDKPFHRFVRDQIAADELYPADRAALAALGLHRLGPLRLNAGLQDDAKNRQEVLTEIVDAVGTAFLGLTFGCARCHDHEFDPITQGDYYGMQAVFAATQPIDVPLVPVGMEPATDEKKTVPSFMAVWDRDRDLEIPATFILERGETHQRLGEVQPTVPSILVSAGEAAGLTVRRLSTTISGASGGDSTGRRAALAEWLTRADHPLTARVFINRLWMHHFGRGIVATPNDFGAMGAAASHPHLLDWLAVEFADNDWSIKHLHRLMVLSATYQQSSSTFSNSSARDPDNELLWRANRRRLEAEVIRDAMLAVSDSLNRSMGGPGVRLPLPPEIAKLQYKGTWQEDPDQTRHLQRTIYLFVKRNNRPPFLESFDVPDTTASCGLRTESSHAGQALMLLNSPLLDRQTRRLAARLEAEVADHDNTASLITRAYRLALSRSPGEEELALGRKFLESPHDEFSDRVADFCLVLFNLDEFLYID